MIELVCKFCGQSFPTHKSRAGRKKYCSKPCQEKARRAAVEAETKRCSRCGEVKPRSEFTVRNPQRGYLASWCKPCSALSAKDWKRRNPEKAREGQRRWEAANPEKTEAMRRRAKEKWIKKRPTYWHDYYMAHRDVYIMRARFKRPLSFDAPLAENFSLLNIVADDRVPNPLDQLIQSEAVREIIGRVVSEVGLNHDAAARYVHSHL